MEQTDGQTDGRIAVSLNAPYGGGIKIGCSEVTEICPPVSDPWRNLTLSANHKPLCEPDDYNGNINSKYHNYRPNYNSRT